MFHVETYLTFLFIVHRCKNLPRMAPLPALITHHSSLPKLLLPAGVQLCYPRGYGRSVRRL